MSKMGRKTTFKFFEVGDTPPDSGVTILEQINLATEQRTTRYLVRYACCATKVEMAHKSIRARQDRKNKGCRSCTIDVAITASAKKRKAKHTLVKACSSEDLTKDYDITPPTWPAASWMVGFDVPFIYAGAS